MIRLRWADFAATVIASVAKQSIPPRNGRMDCFVASLLAMTMWLAPGFTSLPLDAGRLDDSRQLLGVARSPRAPSEPESSVAAMPTARPGLDLSLTLSPPSLPHRWCDAAFCLIAFRSDFAGRWRLASGCCARARGCAAHIRARSVR